MDSDRAEMALSGPCFPLRFLVREESRAVPRERMAGFSDSAIFHRWMDLFWTMDDPEAAALLTPDEIQEVAEFTRTYKSLPWRPIATHPHISDVSESALQKLLPSATRLLSLLEGRVRKV